MHRIPVFYDFEASAPEAGYPIEVGWAFFDPEKDAIASAGFLIRPTPEWKTELQWDETAETVHGITQHELARDGRSPFEIARRMNAALAGRELFSDSTSDEFWLRQMFEAAGEEPVFVIRRTDANVLFDEIVVRTGLDESSYAALRVRADQIAPHTHRAKEDARGLAVLWHMLALRSR
jgi:hypothetical protein